MYMYIYDLREYVHDYYLWLLKTTCSIDFDVISLPLSMSPSREQMAREEKGTESERALQRAAARRIK